MDWLYHYYIEHNSAMWYLSNGWLLSDVHSQHVLTHLANAYAKACIQHHNLTNGISLLHRSQWSWPQVQNTWVPVSIWNTWKLIDLQKTTFLVKKRDDFWQIDYFLAFMVSWDHPKQDLEISTVYTQYEMQDNLCQKIKSWT